jgi:hypothetical protein
MPRPSAPPAHRPCAASLPLWCWCSFQTTPQKGRHCTSRPSSADGRRCARPEAGRARARACPHSPDLVSARARFRDRERAQPCQQSSAAPAAAAHRSRKRPFRERQAPSNKNLTHPALVCLTSNSETWTLSRPASCTVAASQAQQAQQGIASFPCARQTAAIRRATQANTHLRCKHTHRCPMTLSSYNTSSASAASWSTPYAG